MSLEQPKTGYDDFLILKGGLFIYTLTNFESRAIIDVDFLLRGYSNSIDTVKDLIFKIIGIPTGNDYIEMTAKGFEEISPQRKYHGISIQIIDVYKRQCWNTGRSSTPRNHRRTTWTTALWRRVI